jgi:outer membrane protein assembly factor BamB
MAEAVLYIAPSGSGKSRSTLNFGEEAFFINIMGKRLPYRTDRKIQKVQPPDKPLTIDQLVAGLPSKIEEGVSIVQTDRGNIVEALIRYVDQHRPDITRLVIDDWQYVAANHFMRRANQKSYDKFTDIGKEMWSTSNAIAELERDDLIVYFLTHSEDITDAGGNRMTKAKTIGKLVDDKITLEGMFTIVLYGGSELGKDKTPKYYIYTQTNGTNTCKSPEGMFAEMKIENDLAVVDNTIREYYNIPQVTEEVTNA